jgi:hypothetical protein
MRYYSIHFNRPDLIELQLLSIHKLNGELIIINNGPNPNIRHECDRLGVVCYDIKNVGSNSNSHANAINWALANLIDTTSDWALIDHDFFPLYSINFQKLGCDILSAPQRNVPQFTYLHPGMLFCKAGVDLSHINFSPNVGIPGDTASGTYVLDSTHIINWGLCVEYYGEKNTDFYQSSNLVEIIYFESILFGIHYLCASNWIGGNSIDVKNEILKNLLKQNNIL